jgi:hypothetical protein
MRTGGAERRMLSESSPSLSSGSSASWVSVQVRQRGQLTKYCFTQRMRIAYVGSG